MKLSISRISKNQKRVRDCNLIMDNVSDAGVYGRFMRLFVREALKNKRKRSYSVLYVNNAASYYVKEEYYKAALNMVYKYDNVIIHIAKEYKPQCEFFRTVLNNKPLIIIKLSSIYKKENRSALPFMYKILKEWDNSNIDFCIVFYNHYINFNKDPLFSSLVNYVEQSRSDLEIETCGDIYHSHNREYCNFSLAKRGIIQDLHKLCGIENKIYKDFETLKLEQVSS